ncbi:MAG: hypothetical protein KTR31_04520 [Myxococcales bacterium]|nr:hypothetical protein [Myxococcales bacterium]
MIVVLTSLALAQTDPCADEGSIATNSERIAALYEASTADADALRQGDGGAASRAKKRAKTFLEYHSWGQLCTAQDKWHAAWVLLQVDNQKVLDRAGTLAAEALAEHAERGLWLSAYSVDRRRVAGGTRQTFGTQTVLDAEGRLCLVELDGNTTDAKRAEYEVPSLQEIVREVLDANDRTRDKPTMKRLYKRKLVCDREGNPVERR